jgi:molecular chaperone DnaJ
VAGHRLFGRRGKDLTLSVPITFPEAALGAEITVPVLDGEPVTLKVPEGTPNGRTFRIAGRGVPALGGDLLVTVGVAVPRRLSKKERQAVQALAEASTESPRADLGV